MTDATLPRLNNYLQIALRSVQLTHGSRNPVRTSPLTAEAFGVQTCHRKLSKALAHGSASLIAAVHAVRWLCCRVLRCWDLCDRRSTMS